MSPTRSSGRRRGDALHAGRPAAAATGSGRRGRPEGGGWRPREVAAAVAFLAVLGFQFALPAQRLAAVAAGEPAPARFGWQMFSRNPARPAIAALLDDGSERAVDPTTLAARPRAEVPLAELLPAVCAASPRVRAVAVTEAGGMRREVPCPGRGRPPR